MAGTELEVLREAFDRVVSRGGPELVLLRGYAGIGKSSVVNELHKVLVPARAGFATGKFDQFKRDIPYATLARHFRVWCASCSTRTTPSSRDGVAQIWRRWDRTVS